MIESLTIEGYRGLDRFELRDLGRVNLVVGRNDVGKTSVLEAIWLLQNPDSNRPLVDLFKRRKFDIGHSLEADSIWQLLASFNRTQPMRMAAHSSSGTSWSTQIALADRILKLQATSGQDGKPFTLDVHGLTSGTGGPRDARPFAFWFDNADDTEADLVRRVSQLSAANRIPWLVEALRGVDDRLNDVRTLLIDARWQTFLDLGEARLVPLTQTGHGLRYALALLVEIDLHRDGVVLIDEIECGLHHAAMEAVWRAVRSVSALNDLQIFATTHSYECIAAARRAFAEHPDDLRVIRVERVRNVVRPVILDAEHLDAALATGSEIR